MRRIDGLCWRIFHANQQVSWADINATVAILAAISSL